MRGVTTKPFPQMLQQHYNSREPFCVAQKSRSDTSDIYTSCTEARVHSLQLKYWGCATRTSLHCDLQNAESEDHKRSQVQAMMILNLKRIVSPIASLAGLTTTVQHEIQAGSWTEHAV